MPKGLPHAPLEVEQPAGESPAEDLEHGQDTEDTDDAEDTEVKTAKGGVVEEYHSVTPSGNGMSRFPVRPPRPKGVPTPLEIDQPAGEPARTPKEKIVDEHLITPSGYVPENPTSS